jgi:hypothetical protein
MIDLASRTAKKAHGFGRRQQSGRFGLVHLVWCIWSGASGLVHLVWNIWSGASGLVHLVWCIWSIVN